jgi:hypothetical protein
MVIQLTEEQRQALDFPQETLPRVLDPKTNKIYVLIAAEHFERIQALFEDVHLTKEEQLFFLREAGKRAGWDDPEMDVYNELDPRRKS